MTGIYKYFFKTRCQNGHPLEENTLEKKYVCDQCRKRCDAGSKVYICESCNICNCHDCFDFYLVTLKTQKRNQIKFCHLFMVFLCGRDTQK